MLNSIHENSSIFLSEIDHDSTENTWTVWVLKNRNLLQKYSVIYFFIISGRASIFTSNPLNFCCIIFFIQPTIVIKLYKFDNKVIKKINSNRHSVQSLKKYLEINTLIASLFIIQLLIFVRIKEEDIKLFLEGSKIHFVLFREPLFLLKCRLWQKGKTFGSGFVHVNKIFVHNKQSRY